MTAIRIDSPKGYLVGYGSPSHAFCHLQSVMLIEQTLGSEIS